MFAICILIFGAVWTVTGAFVPIWQPIPETLPPMPLLPIAAGLLFLASGTALFFRRTSQLGAIAPIAVMLLFVSKWITRIILLPTVIGTWSGTGEELVPVLGAILILSPNRYTESVDPRVLTTCRLLFGFCALSFGLVHFEALQQTANMVPTWIPGSGRFWAITTGACHALGGVAILINFRSVLAARLLAVMYLAFALLIWLPRLAGELTQPITWTGTAVTIILAASALVLAACLGREASERAGGKLSARAPVAR